MNNDIYTSLSYHTEYCHCPKNHLSSAYLYLPASSTWLSFSPHQTSDLFIVSISLPFPKCHRVAIIYYEAFSDWLLSLGNMYLRFPYFFSWFDSSFVFGCAQSFLSCLTLCDSMDCSLPGSSVHGILQARILKWVAISFCMGSSWPRDQTHAFCVSCNWKAPIWF